MVKTSVGATNRKNGSEVAPNRRHGGRIPWEPSEIDKRAAKLVRQLREKRGWTQGELAEKIGQRRNVGKMTYQSVYDIEQGNTQLTLSNISDLSKIFDVPMSLFFSEDDWHPTIEDEMATIWNGLSDDQKQQVKVVAKVFGSANERAKSKEH